MQHRRLTVFSFSSDQQELVNEKNTKKFKKENEKVDKKKFCFKHVLRELIRVNLNIREGQTSITPLLELKKQPMYP